MVRSTLLTARSFLGVISTLLAKFEIQNLHPDLLRSYDFGDAPDSGEGTGPWNYRTSAADDGASHGIAGGLSIGESVKADAFASPSILADGDDDDGLGNSQNEIFLLSGLATQVSVNVTNTTGRLGVLYGWIDLNIDGVFDESERTQIDVPSGTVGPVPMTFPNISAGVAGKTYARFRLTTDVAFLDDPQPTGPAGDGEVED